MSSILKVDTINEVTSANGVTVDGLSIKDSKLVTADSVVTANITADAVTLAKMAPGTDGNIISYDASGNPVAVATGNDGQVLTSAGAGAPPAFETLPAGTTLSGSTNNTVATVTGANALAGEANLTFDGSNLTVTSTSAGSTTNPFVIIDRNSASPADNDVLGRVNFRGRTDSGANADYVFLTAQALDVSNGGENGSLNIAGLVGAAERSFVKCKPTEVIINEDSEDMDFRVESNANTHALFVQASNGNIGIQQTNPAYTVEIGDADSGRGMMFNLYSNVGQIKTRASSTDSQTHMNFEAGLASAGTIKTNNGSTSYNTSSDYRLKENVDYDWEATTRLKQLKPARFNWIADSDNTILDGFIAHEVTNIVPEAVSGEKDAIQVWLQGEELPEGVSVGDNKLDADGNTIPDYQGIDQSKLVPLLIKTIQELEARITALES